MQLCLAVSIQSSGNINLLLILKEPKNNLINQCNGIKNQATSIFYFCWHDINLLLSPVYTKIIESTKQEIIVKIYILSPITFGCYWNYFGYDWLILCNHLFMKTSVSVSQMLKGSTLFFTYVITIIFGSKKLTKFQHFWMLSIVFSLALIGYSNSSSAH